MNLAQLILTGSLRFYRWVVSPAKTLLFGPLGRCRFTPSCSAYALDAIRQHGAVRGTWLALKRLGQCHPWGGCGHDPVPPVSPSEAASCQGAGLRTESLECDALTRRHARDLLGSGA